MSHFPTAVQSQHTPAIAPREIDAVRILISCLIDQGIHDHKTIACRVRQGHRNFPHALIDQLFTEAMGEDGARSGAGPRAELSTSSTPAPTPENQLPRGYEYQSIRVSEYQEYQESQEYEEPRGGFLSQEEKQPEGGATEEQAQPRQAVIPKDAIEAAVELAAQIAQEQNFCRTFAGEALWSWPFRLARRLKQFEATLTDDAGQRAVVAFADTLSQRWPRGRPLCPLGFQELWMGFLDAWSKTRVPEGQDTLETAVQQARSRPLRLTAPLLPDLCHQIASVAYHLTAIADDGILLLPQARLANCWAPPR
jgi:hypothetical protein